MPDRGAQAAEKRAWLWVVLFTLVLYAGIFVARDLQHFVDAHFGRASFLLVVLGALAVAGFFAFRSVHRSAFSMLCLLAVGAAYAAGAWHLRRDPEEALHFVEYGAVSFLLFRAFNHRLRDPLVYAAAFLFGGLLGTLDEVIQYLAPRRYFDFRDIAINVLAVALMQIAIAFGLRPGAVRPPVQAASVRAVCRLAMAWAAVLSCCFFNTVQRQTWFLENIPHPGFMDRLNDLMVEYGHRLASPDGATYFSRLTVEEMRVQDATNAPGTAELLDRYPGTNGYARFHVEVSQLDCPVAYEARIHLFRRDKYAGDAVNLRRSPDRARGAATIAFRENQLVERLYPNALAQSRYVLRPDWREIVERLADTTSPYESPVSNQLFTRLSERQIQAALLAVMLVAIGVHVYYRRRE